MSGIRDNLIITYARKLNALDQAGHAAKNASKRLSFEEKQLARRVSAETMLRWLYADCPDQGPEVTAADLAARRGAQGG